MSGNCYLLTWRPLDERTGIGFAWETLADDIDQVALGKPGSTTEWNAGHRKSVRVGERFFLLKQGKEPRGIMGSGVIDSDVVQGPHWDEDKQAEGVMANYVGIRFDRLVDPESVLPFAQLPLKFSPMASGQRVPPELVDKIQRLWDKHVPPRSQIDLAKELEQNTFIEGEAQAVLSNRYERDPEARRACIMAHGTDCKVCGMSFGKAYGELGEGFIHVHHTTPLSKGGKRKVDPVRDMVPVCANCHSMLHRRDPPLSVADLKKAFGGAKHWRRPT